MSRAVLWATSEPTVGSAISILTLQEENCQLALPAFTMKRNPLLCKKLICYLLQIIDVSKMVSVAMHFMLLLIA